MNHGAYSTFRSNVETLAIGALAENQNIKKRSNDSRRPDFSTMVLRSGPNSEAHTEGHIQLSLFYRGEIRRLCVHRYPACCPTLVQYPIAY